MGRKLSFTGLAGSSGGGGGGGGGGGNWWEDTWTPVGTTSFYVRGSSYTNQSSDTYQRFGALKHKGAYGGIFDPWTSNNSGGTYAKGFFINQSTGAVSEASGNSIWSHSYGATFTTLHRGNVGNDYVVRGGCRSPNYGSTYRDWWYGARFNSDGSVAGDSYASGSPNGDLAEHSNGDLAMSQDSVNGTTYFRRSGYNRNDGKYWHSRAYFNGSGGSYNEWSNPSSNTSTNYCTSFTPQERGSNPYGCLWWYNSSGTEQFSPLTGDSLTRSNESAAANFPMGWSSNCHGFVLNNGLALVSIDGTPGRSGGLNLSNGSMSTIPSSSNFGVIGLCAHSSYSQAVHIPRPTWPEVANSWLMATSGKGYTVIVIDPSTYSVSVKTSKGTEMAGLGATPPKESNQLMSITGSTNQYIVYAYVKQGKASISVWDNPFKDIDMS